METLVLIVHVLLAIGIIALVLLQQGKGAEAGASFGAGASQTVFGSSGSTSFLARFTGVLATGIFITSFLLAMVAKQKADEIGDAGIPAAEVIESRVEQVKEAELPALEAAKPKAPESDIPKAD